MKKFVTVLFLILTVCTISFAAKTVTVEFWTLSLSTFSDYINEVINSFEAANPGIEIDWVDVPMGSIQQKLVAAIASGKAPDLVNLNAQYVLDYVAKNALQPLDEYVTKEDKFLYWEGLWKGTVIDNKAYAITWYVGPSGVMIYNKQLFEKAGLDPNKPPETWEEAIEYSRIIKENTGAYGIQPNPGGINNLSDEGIQLVSPDGKKATFNTPEAVKKLESMQQAFKEGLFPPDFIIGDWQTGTQKYSAGELAMFPASTMIKHIQINSPSIYAVSDIAPSPRKKSGVTRLDPMNLAVPYNAKNKEEAVKFGLWLTSPYWQIEFSKLATIVPSTKVTLETDLWFVERAEEDLNIKAQMMSNSSKLMMYAEDSTAIGKIIGASKYSEFKRILDEYWQAGIKGEYTAQEALSLAEKECNKLLAE